MAWIGAHQASSTFDFFDEWTMYHSSDKNVNASSRRLDRLEIPKKRPINPRKKLDAVIETFRFLVD
jgi:hypothetical protein